MPPRLPLIFARPPLRQRLEPLLRLPVLPRLLALPQRQARLRFPAPPVPDTDERGTTARLMPMIDWSRTTAPLRSMTRSRRWYYKGGVPPQPDRRVLRRQPPHRRHRREPAVPMTSTSNPVVERDVPPKPH